MTLSNQKRINGFNLERQFETLEVKNRVFTGFGILIYFDLENIYFDLENQADFTKILGDRKKNISSPIEIYLEPLEHQISFELNLNDKSQFDFLEIVPNGINAWNGKYEMIKNTANQTNKQ